MIELLRQLTNEQTDAADRDGYYPDMTIVLSTGEKVSGLIYVTPDDDATISVTRVTDDTPHNKLYADIPRHYRIDAVVGAYYTEGS